LGVLGGTVRKVNASGTITTIVGGGFIGPTVDGIPATNASLSAVHGLAFDAAGNLYLSDRFNDRIRKVTGVTTSPPFIFTPPSGLTVLTKGLPHGEVGVSYFQTLSAVGGAPPYIWSIASGSLPPGLNLSTAGQISGTPTTTGPFGVVVQVKDANGAIATQPLTITISGPLAVATTSLSNGTVGAVYNQTLTATGGAGAYTWTLASGSLPAGTTLSTVGVLSGTPTTVGSFTFTVKVTDLSGQSASAPFTIIVIVANPVPAGSHILFIIQPPGPTGGGSTGLQAVAQLFDTNNAPISGATLSASFGAKPCPDAALSGTLTAVTDSNGLAAFSGITSNRGGNGYTGVATATSNPQVFATSIPFNIRGFCDTGSLAAARAIHRAVALPNGTVLVAGGFSNLTSVGTALAGAEIYNPATHSFTAVGNMNSPRGQFTMTLLNNGLVLVAGGLNGSTALSSAELFDPSTNKFTLLPAPMSTARTAHVATLLASGKVLLTGGASSSAVLNTAEIFDPATNTFAPTGSPMTAAREVHHADLLPNGQVLITGGLSNGANNILASAELYDPAADTFTPTGSMTTPRVNHASALLFTGKVLVAGGGTPSGSGSVTTSTAEIYDPSSGTFSPTGNATRPLSGFYSPVPVLADGSVFLADGGTNAQIYDPSTGTFRVTGNMTAFQVQPQASLLPDGTVLLAGGSGSGFAGVSNAEIFYPANPPFLVQEFTATGSLNTAREYHTATLLGNGLVLVAGGTGSSVGVLPGAELYNPATGTFSATGNMSTARYQHTATLLPNGTVLIAGGVGASNNNILAGAELYNPATGAFTATGGLNTGRYQHTATLLSNGLVLIVGGIDSSGNFSASAELYNPATGTFTATGGLNTGRGYHTATLLSNGLVLIAGGEGPGVLLAIAELYNPATGTFAATGSLNTARLLPTATLLPTGKVLVGGGVGGQGTSELYDPATGTFTPSGSLNTARVLQTATLLNNGLVLIAGGSSQATGRNIPIASAELYDPATGTFTVTDSLNTARELHTATLLPTGKVLVSGGDNGGRLATSELYQFGATLQPLSCSYEGHIKSVAAFSNPTTMTAIQFVNASTTQTFQVFWLDYAGQRFRYNTLGPGQSYVQQTFLTHPWVIADTSPAATCQEIYLPLPEQAPAVFGAPITDAAASFEQGWITHSNPNGVWSYGYSSGFTSPITLYNQTVQNGVNGPNAQYWLSPSVDIGTSPAAEFNNGPAFDDGNVNFLANEFVLVAGIGGQYSDLVFTAPADGTYSVVSSFRGDQHGIGTLVGVVANGNILFSSSVTAVGQIVPFSTQVSLKAGNTLVFSVGPGGGSQNTGVSATITGP